MICVFQLPRVQLVLGLEKSWENLNLSMELSPNKQRDPNSHQGPDSMYRYMHACPSMGGLWHETAGPQQWQVAGSWDGVLGDPRKSKSLYSSAGNHLLFLLVEERLLVMTIFLFPITDRAGTHQGVLRSVHVCVCGVGVPGGLMALHCIPPSWGIIRSP